MISIYFVIIKSRFHLAPNLKLAKYRYIPILNHLSLLLYPIGIYRQYSFKMYIVLYV